MGKILGGGYPMGSLAGKREYMEMIAPSGNVYQAGTFNGNPISVSAGLATLKQLDDSFYKDLSDKGNYMRKGISDILDEQGLQYQVAGLSSMFQLYFTDKKVMDYKDAKTSNTEKFTKYFHNLLGAGVFIPPSQFECCFISLFHNEEDLEHTLEAIEQALKD